MGFSSGSSDASSALSVAVAFEPDADVVFFLLRFFPPRGPRHSLGLAGVGVVGVRASPVGAAGAWLAGAAAFVLGLHQMNSPATARNGNRLSAGGMAVAVVATLISLVTRTGGLSRAGFAHLARRLVVGGGVGPL